MDGEAEGNWKKVEANILIHLYRLTSRVFLTEPVIQKKLVIQRTRSIFH